MNVLEQMSAEEIEREMASLPEARREKLHELRRAIEEGRYRVSAELLSERLIRHMM